MALSANLILFSLLILFRLPESDLFVEPLRAKRALARLKARRAVRNCSIIPRRTGNYPFSPSSMRFPRASDFLALGERRQDDKRRRAY